MTMSVIITDLVITDLVIADVVITDIMACTHLGWSILVQGETKSRLERREGGSETGAGTEARAGTGKGRE